MTALTVSTLPIFFGRSAAMCFFERIQYRCGSWKWGRFRQQCNKEYRIGETCGLKLVYRTQDISKNCIACIQVIKKQARAKKMIKDLERWERDGNRPATVERAKRELDGLQCSILDLQNQHLKGEEFGGSQQRRKPARITANDAEVRSQWLFHNNAPSIIVTFYSKRNRFIEIFTSSALF